MDGVLGKTKQKQKQALRVGGGVKGRAIEEKKLFLEPFFERSNVSTSIKLEGGLGLNGPAIKAYSPYFCGFPNSFDKFKVQVSSWLVFSG